jgi:hypothetical protein
MDQIYADPKRIGIDWGERRLISKLYMDQIVKIKLDQGQARSMKIGREVRQGCCLSPILFNLYKEYLTREHLEEYSRFLNRKTSNSRCEICRWHCATGYGRSGAIGHD